MLEQHRPAETLLAHPLTNGPRTTWKAFWRNAEEETERRQTETIEEAWTSVRPDPTAACVPGNGWVWSPQEQEEWRSLRSARPPGEGGMVNVSESSQDPSSPEMRKRRWRNHRLPTHQPKGKGPGREAGERNGGQTLRPRVKDGT